MSSIFKVTFYTGQIKSDLSIYKYLSSYCHLKQNMANNYQYAFYLQMNAFIPILLVLGSAMGEVMQQSSGVKSSSLHSTAQARDSSSYSSSPSNIVTSSDWETVPSYTTVPYASSKFTYSRCNLHFQGAAHK
jgi:hypothetical protein